MSNIMGKLIDFLKKYEIKLVLITGFLLISVISFQFGFIQGKTAKSSPLIIEKASQKSQNEPQTTQNAQAGKYDISTKNSAPASASSLPKNCTYVGSKNSNKYHLPTCRWAKQIKPANIVCFKDAKDAQAKGYLPDKNCIK